jgi:uncharacterized Zn-binding protein involved in type VI secretion
MEKPDFQKLFYDEAGHYSEEKVQRYLAEKLAEQSARPVKGRYPFATLGAKTRMGGEVATATSCAKIDGFPIARVGDIIRYPDGSESRIISGAGSASITDGPPEAIVGSAADNGDVITESLQTHCEIIEYADADPIPGLLEAGYMPPVYVETEKGLPQ